MNVSKEKIKKISQKREDNLILRINKNSNIVKYNNKFENVFGYARNELLEESFFDNLVPKRYLNQWDKICNDSIKNFSISDFKLPIITKNGHELMISWSCFPIKDSNGNVEDIDFVGNLITSWNDSEDAIPVSNESKNENNQIMWQEVDSDNQKETKKVTVDDIDVSTVLKKYDLVKKENSYLKKYIKKLKDNNINNYSSQKNFFGKSAYKISDVIGGKKRREEFNSIKNELDAREEYLKNLDSHIKKERNSVNKQKSDLIRWREKLELLESDIESRKKWVESKEKALKKLDFSHDKEDLVDKQNVKDDKSSMIDKISDSAAIVQRGVFKQVNSSFEDLLGYSSNEIIDKSLFDFIVSDGFSSIENYYLHRLKGNEVSTINTIFLTKDSDKIDVQVSTKPTVFNGEKADLFVIKKNNLENNPDSSENIDDTEENEMSNIINKLKDKR